MLALMSRAELFSFQQSHRHFESDHVLYTCALVYLNASGLVSKTWLAHHHDKSFAEGNCLLQLPSIKAFP